MIKIPEMKFGRAKRNLLFQRPEEMNDNDADNWNQWFDEFEPESWILYMRLFASELHMLSAELNVVNKSNDNLRITNYDKGQTHSAWIQISDKVEQRRDDCLTYIKHRRDSPFCKRDDFMVIPKYIIDRLITNRCRWFFYNDRMITSDIERVISENDKQQYISNEE